MAVSISVLSHDAVGLFLLVRGDLLTCCDEQESLTELSVLLVTIWLGDLCCDRNSAKHGAVAVQESSFSFVFKAFVPRSTVAASFDDTCEGETLGDLRLLKAIVIRFLLPPLVISSFN
jgi:hypothetical protein